MAAETSVDAKVPVYLALTKVNTINQRQVLMLRSQCI